MQVVLLPVGAELYAVPMDWVREVIARPVVTLLTTAPDRVLGLFNLRGEIVPLFDTAVLLGLGPVGVAAAGSRTAPNFAAVLQTPQGLVGLVATDLPERASLGTTTGPSELPGTAGVFQLGRRVAVLLDVRALFSPDASRGPDRLPAASVFTAPAITRAIGRISTPAIAQAVAGTG